MVQPNKTYIIQHKETKEMFIARSGKSYWKQPGHAKNAWNQSFYTSRQVEDAGMEMVPGPSYYEANRQRTPLFSEQDVFEIIELKHKAHSKLEEAINLIKYLQGRCNYDAEQMIVKFLESVDEMD